MKKMIMTIALMLGLCGAANAALVQWGNVGSTSPIVGLDGSTALTSTTAPSFAIYLVATGFDMESPSADTLGSAGLASKSAGSLSGASANYTFGTDAGNGDSFQAYATATFDGTDYYMVINAGTWSITASDDGGVDVFSWNAGSYGGLGVAGQENVWIAVPEPTSMALLGLGIAVLGLRRKIRK